MLRNVFNLDRPTHRYILETLREVPHLYVQLLARFVTFVQSLRTNDAFQVRFLASLCLSDMTTVLRKSTAKIMDLCNHHDLNTLTAKLVKKNVLYMRIPDCEKWRIGVIQDMQNILNGNGPNPDLTLDEAKCILDYACIA